MIYPRAIYTDIEKHLDTPEAVIITGMRRTGKTTLLTLIRDHIKTENRLFIDLENPLSRKYFEEEDYEKIKATLEFLGLSFRKRSHILLDEIQHVRTLPSVIKYFIDHYKVKFFVTGSASYYLKNLFTESLAGRKAIFELFPLTFREFLVFKKSSFKIPKNEAAVTKTIFDAIDRLYEEYMRYGGFPEIVLKEDTKEKRSCINSKSISR